MAGDMHGKGVCVAGGMHGRGVCMAEGVHSRGHAWEGACVQERWPLKWAVSIVLECILVADFFCFLLGKHLMLILPHLCNYGKTRLPR